MNPAQLQQFFAARSERGEPMVLATVTSTEGSTYSKTGDLMLIDINGIASGMLSGGCLENDLAIRAQVALESGQTQSVTYSLAAGDEDIWGLGVGCEGSMTISLQPLSADNDYQPLVLPAIRQLLVLGAGRDVAPLIALAANLGWHGAVVDHRPAYIEQHQLPAGFSARCAPPEELGDTLTLDDYDAAVVMSHHLASDREYLRQLAPTALGYIGVLGPVSRTERLLEELAETAVALRERISAPAGLRLGGRGAESIALSILAELQQSVSPVTAPADRPAKTPE